MKKIAVALAACMLAATPALAQSTGEKTGVNSALGITPKTADFITEAAQSDMFEIASSKLAETKTKGPVNGFAQQMVTDHTKTTNELKPIAQKDNVPLPPDMSDSQKDMITKLQGLSGQDFAKQYMDDQVSGHKDAVSLFQRYGKGGDKPQAKAWANKTLPILQHHLDMAQQLDK
jgi:putative membrane protein